MTDRNGNQDSDTVYVRIDDLDPETFQIPPAAHAVVNYPEGAEAFLENTRVTPDGSGTGYPHCAHRPDRRRGLPLLPHRRRLRRLDGDW